MLPQLAHVWGLVSRLPKMFSPHQKQFAPQISNSLAKLCLPSNCSFENRELAIGAVELLWLFHVTRSAAFRYVRTLRRT